jgi:hypothetical protein
MNNRKQGRIDVPLSVWPGIAGPAQITVALVGRLARIAEPVLLVDCESDPTELAASARSVTWLCASRRTHDAAVKRLAALAPADRTQVRLRHVPRAAMAEALAQYAGRFRLVVTGFGLTGQSEVWRAAVAALQPSGRLAVVGADGATALPQVAGSQALSYQAQIVCASKAAFDQATAAAEAIGPDADLPVTLTRVHTPVALFCRAEAPGGDHV